MNTQVAFSIVAVFYSVANLGSMGLELKLRETIKSLRSVRILGKSRMYSEFSLPRRRATTVKSLLRNLPPSRLRAFV